MTNGIRKVKQGVDIFDKRNFDSWEVHLGQCFRIQPRLQYFPRSRQYKTGFIVHGAQPIRILLSVFSFSLILARVRGKRSIKPLLFCNIIFFFPSRVNCHVLFRTEFCSAARNWRELYIEPDYSELPWCLHIEPYSIKRINVFPTSSDT